MMRVFPGIHVLCLLLVGLLATGCASLSGHELTETGSVKKYMTRLDTPSGPVNVFVREEGFGPPILFLHGFGASTYNWRYVQPQLAQNYRTIAIDLKGFGKTDKPFDHRYSVFDQADLVERFIEKLRLTNLTVVGHSYGGGVALVLAVNLAKSRPQRLSKLVLIDSLAYRQHLPMVFNLLKTPVISEVSMIVIPPEVQARAALEFAYLDDRKVTWEAAREYAKPLYTIGGKFAAIRTAEQIIPARLDRFISRYKTIDVPVLVLWCRQDRIVPLRNARRLDKELQKSQLKVIEGCGHSPQEEKPQETVGILGHFLRK